MKLATAFLFMLFIIGCKSKEPMKMPGAYNMLSQKAQSGKTDTSYTSRKQMKIFTDDFMMYANVNPSDSSSSFGIGSYTMNGDTLTENVLYTSSDSTYNDSLRNFTLIINKTNKGYEQVIPEMKFGGNTWKWTEDYESVGTNTKTALDGAWKLTNVFWIRNKDTSSYDRVQYKFYYAGNVIWGNSFKDSLNNKKTGIGFGKFTMTGNKVKESMISSTYSDVAGHDFDIDIEMKGTDGFSQTTTYEEGNKSIEVYQRMKK